jgi:pilus assembly protein CpaB
MNRNTRTIVVLLVAVVMAGLAAFGVYLAVQSRPVREVEVARTQAVVATHPIAVGTLVTKDDLKLVAWPAATPVPGSFTEIDKVVNRGIFVAVSENEPLTESKLAPVGSGAGLPPTITEGMRAISVKVNYVIGVAGLFVPGTGVDLFVTAKGSYDAATTETRTVLS